MFSQTCVIPSVHRGVCPGDLHLRGSAFRRGLHPGGMHPGGVCMGGGLGRPSTQSDTMGYGQRAGGMHPTGMHSCYDLNLLKVAEFPKARVIHGILLNLPILI